MKKGLFMTLLLVLVLSLGSVAFGDTVSPETMAIVQEDVDQTNIDIDQKIDEAVARSIVIVDTYNAAVALAELTLEGQALDARLDALYDAKEREINNLIDTLVDETNAIAAACFQRCADLGVTVICELVPVEIDGRIVMIDPLKVVGD
jgi:hypothetical protein